MLPTFQLASLFLCLLVSQCSARPIAPRIERGVERIDPLKLKDEENARHQKEENEKAKDISTISVFEGDILINTEELRKMHQSRQKRAGSGMLPMHFDDRGDDSKDEAGNDRKWPNCRIPYKFDQFLGNSMRMAFRVAMDMWEKDTCLSFELAGNHDVDYLHLKEGDACRSFIGKRGGAQNVSIAIDCSGPGNAAHELGHAIGLWHEHSRYDRDEYIQINRSNINRNYLANFDIIARNTLNNVPDVGYDIQSIMHYGPFAFSSGPTLQETITIRPDADLPELRCTNSLEMGQREALSYKDKKRASAHYNCNFTLVEPPCVTPTTPMLETMTTEQPTTIPIPTPTATIPTPSPVKLNSGTLMALKFGNGNHTYGMQCTPSPGCQPKRCEDHGGDSCHNPDYQFQIINHHSASSKRLKTGNTVLLRSVNSPTNWLDCSASPTKCVISPCTEDNADDGANSSYISNCSRHHFQLHAVKRGMNKGVNNHNRLQFKYSGGSGTSYLTCNSDKYCRLLEGGACPDNDKVIFPRRPKKNGNCNIESFSVDILA